MSKAKFPRPSMVASGESSTPFTGSDVVSGYQPIGWNKGLGEEVDYEHWGATGVGGQQGPIEGAADGYGPIGLAILAARQRTK